MLSPEKHDRDVQVRRDGAGRSLEGVRLSRRRLRPGRRAAGSWLSKRLSDAIADGDRIYCTIRGSALNNDGFSNGLTAPSPQAQEAVIRDACAETPGSLHSDVQYVEAHGTGTMLGDPIEAGALGAVLGRGRPSRAASAPDWLGQNEPRASRGGRRDGWSHQSGRSRCSTASCPRPCTTLNRTPTSTSRGSVFACRLRSSPGPRRASVALLESARSASGVPTRTFCSRPSRPPPSRLVRLAAAEAGQLVADAKALADRVRAVPSNLGSIAEPASLEGHRHRLAVAARSAEDLASPARRVRGRPAAPGASRTGSRQAARRQVVLVFGGQGSQWLRDGPRTAARGRLGAGAPRSLRRGDARLRQVVAPRAPSERRRAAVRRHVVRAAGDLRDAGRTRRRLSARARPPGADAVIGQSMGEVAAAYVAGALSLDDAARVICVRSALVGQARGGRMAVVGLSLSRQRPTRWRRTGTGSAIAVAASARKALWSRVSKKRWTRCARSSSRAASSFRDIRVDYASHSPLHGPAPAGAPQGARPDVRPRDCKIAFWSTVTGEPLQNGKSLDAEYWARRNLREPVLFAPTLQRLASEGAPLSSSKSILHPVLAQFVQRVPVDPDECVGRRRLRRPRRGRDAHASRGGRAALRRRHSRPAGTAGAGAWHSRAGGPVWRSPRGRPRRVPGASSSRPHRCAPRRTPSGHRVQPAGDPVPDGVPGRAGRGESRRPPGRRSTAWRTVKPCRARRTLRARRPRRSSSYFPARDRSGSAWVAS